MTFHFLGVGIESTFTLQTLCGWEKIGAQYATTVLAPALHGVYVGPLGASWAHLGPNLGGYVGPVGPSWELCWRMFDRAQSNH